MIAKVLKTLGLHRGSELEANVHSRSSPFSIVDEISRAYREDLPDLQASIDALYPSRFVCSQFKGHGYGPTYQFKIQDTVSGLWTAIDAEKWRRSLEVTCSEFLEQVGSTNYH